MIIYKVYRIKNIGQNNDLKDSGAFIYRAN